eukprot:PhM_4_TR18885/c2_g1_i1/m.76526
MSTEYSNSFTAHFRKVYSVGFHPTALRAATLLSIANEHNLCPFTTQRVLSFCIDTTQLLIVDILSERTDFTSSKAPMCLVVDDHPTKTHVVTKTVWSRTTPPKHFVFTPMNYHRALLWVREWMTNRTMAQADISLDMHDTYTDVRALFDCLQFVKIVELTLPSVVRATHIHTDFLCCCHHLTYFDASPLANVKKIRAGFLMDCSSLTSLDISQLTNVNEIGAFFLNGCSALTSLDLSLLANVSETKQNFLYGCSALTCLDLSPFTNVSEIEGGFLSACESLRSIDLSPLANVREVGQSFLEGCSALTSLDLSPLTN